MRGIRSAISIRTSVGSDFQRIPSPLFMVWESTYDCNLHCSRCYLGKSRNGNGHILDTEGIKSIIQESAQLGLFCLVITGGEPLLRNDIFDIRAYASRLGLIVSLTTNGILIDDTNIDEISKFDHITISIDSMHEASYRETFEGDATYTSRLMNMVQNIKRLSSSVLINVQIVIDRDNWDCLLDINRKFYSAGVDTVFQLRYGNEFQIMQDRWDSMIEDMRFRSKRLGWIQKRFLRLFPLISNGDMASPCLALTSNFVVSPEGYLMPCNYRREKVASLGGEAALPEIWKNLGTLRKRYSSQKRGCTCANTCFIPPAMLLS